MTRTGKIAAIVGGGLAMIVVVLVVLAIANLGGSDNASSSGNSGNSGNGNQSQPQFPGGGGPQGGVDQTAIQEFRDCLKEHGVDLPDPGSQPRQPGQGPPSGFNPGDSKFRKALSACRDKLPQGIGPPGGQGAGPPGVQ